jgi:hypothetical protein
MENINEIEARLWSYIDGMATSDETTSIEKLIAENSSWRIKYHELLEVHQALGSMELEEPSMRFTRNVMEEIGRQHIAPATRSYLNNKVIGGIGIFFLVMIVGFLIYGIAQINWSEAGDPGSVLGIDLAKPDYSRIFNNDFVNGLMMLQVVIGLLFLDRFLAAKRRRFRNEAEAGF